MSVYKPKNSPYYQYDFQRGGHRFHGSTGATTRREAEAYERIEKDKAKVARAVSPAEMMSIESAWLRFWGELGQHDARSDTTFARMEALQDGLTGILAKRGRPALVIEIDQDCIATYVAQRRGVTSRLGRLMTSASVNRELQILRRILRRAARTWRVPLHLPDWSDLMLPEADERVVDISRETEADIIGRMRPDFRPAARWLVLTGLRLSNALPLHPSSVRLDMGVIEVRQKSRKPGGKLHVLPITGAMRDILEAEMGHLPDAVFTYAAQRTKNGRVRGQRYPLVPTTFYNEFKAAAAAAGLPGLRPHDLRHVAGTRTLRASGGNLRAAQKHLGHARITTTIKYAHYMVDELRETMERAHNPEQNPEPAAKSPAKRLRQKAKSA